MKNDKRKTFVKVLASPITLFLALILCVVMAGGTLRMYRNSASVSNKYAATQAELLRLQAEQTNLISKVNSLSTETGVETELRTKYRAVKDGESVAVIVDNSSTSTVVGTSPTTTIQKGWWGSFWQSLGF